jgi:hypothetical protein
MIFFATASRSRTAPKVTSLGRFPGVEAAPSPPVLVPRAGGGGDGRWQQNNWVWPPPPEGPLAFICEWPALGIALSRVQIEAAKSHVQILPPLLKISPTASRGGRGFSWAETSSGVSTASIRSLRFSFS